MSWKIGDWTTWDGLTEENDTAPVVFGNKPAVKAPAAAPAAAKPREVSKAKGTGVAFKGIEKKKKKPRTAGLMKVVESPKAQPAEDEAEDASEEVTFEGPSVPSPYIVNTKNPFAALGDLMDMEEAEEEAAAKAEAEAVSKRAVAAKPSKITAAVEAVAASPIVRRTRGAIRSTFEKVVDFVKNSPALVDRSRSVLTEQNKSSANEKVEVKVPAAAPKRAIAAPKRAAAAPEAAPMRRSSRLRPTAA